MESTWHAAAKEGRLVNLFPVLQRWPESDWKLLKGRRLKQPLPLVPLVPICSQIPSPPFPVLLCLAGNSTSQSFLAAQALGCFLLVGGQMGVGSGRRRRQGDCHFFHLLFWPSLIGAPAVVQPRHGFWLLITMFPRMHPSQ